MKKQTSFLVLSCLCLIDTMESQGQSCLNAGSLSGHIGNLSFDASIGEMAIVSTAYQNQQAFTQGYLQPGQPNSKTTQLPPAADNPVLSVYPNPTLDKVHLELQVLAGSMVDLKLMNSLGQVLQEKKLFSDHDQFSSILDLSAYPEGNYLLLLQCQSTDASKNIFTYKIQKTNQP